MNQPGIVLVLALLGTATHAPILSAHAGPPFPIVLNESAGTYHVSVWTDPDATDDGTAGGQFWVMVRLLDGSPVPGETRARVTIRPLDRAGAEHSGLTEPVKDVATRQFVALLMDHEGRYAVETEVFGPRGAAVLHAEVDATYDLRPAPVLLLVYALPFVAIGFFWLKLMRQRRGPAIRGGAAVRAHRGDDERRRGYTR